MPAGRKSPQSSVKPLDYEQGCWADYNAKDVFLMGKLSYILGRALRMDYGELFRTVGVVHGITGRNRPAVLADIVSCGLRYGAGFNDYLLCEFYNLTPEQRATYVTRSVNNTLVQMLNDPEYYKYFDYKSAFYSTFAELIGREWLDFPAISKEQFAEFVKDKDAVIVKPNNGTGGKGVEKLTIADFKSVDMLFTKLKEDNIGVVEEVLKQHPGLNELNPYSVNTLRIVTIRNETGGHILYAHLRIGNGGRPVDNLHSGGMFAPIDLDTGRIQYPAYDKDRKTYEKHPMTGVTIQGMQIPLWEQAKELCLKASEVVPQMRYVGWDVAVTPKRPVLVEGNNLPGYDILQMPPHTPDKIGMLPRFREFVDGI